jgi:addiction module HigA family antidote
LSRVANGKAGISPDMALRLAAWLETSPESWINMQSAYDLYQAAQKQRLSIKPVHSIKVQA